MPELHPMLRLCRRLMMWVHAAVQADWITVCTVYVEDANTNNPMLCLRLAHNDDNTHLVWMSTLYLSPEEAVTLFGEDFGPPLRVFRGGAAMMGLTDDDLPPGDTYRIWQEAP